MLPTLIDAARRRCAAALEESALVAVADALAREGVDAASTERLLNEISETDPRVRDRILTLRTATGAGEGALERLLLLRSALSALPRLSSLPVAEDVKRLFCETFEYIAVPPRGAIFDARRGSFIALSKLVTLRRFPAGQFHWEQSGLPRSWLLKASGRERLRLLWSVATRLKGFGPVFFIHLNPIRKNRHVLTEQASDRSYFRMAQSLARQPEVKGLVACSWLNSPDTFAISPHLAWMNRTFADNGALIVRMGPADPNSGVLTRSPERQQAYEAGTFKPTLGLVVWPRSRMLAWAAAHPELEGGSAPATRLRKETVSDAIGHAS